MEYKEVLRDDDAFVKQLEVVFEKFQYEMKLDATYSVDKKTILRDLKTIFSDNTVKPSYPMDVVYRCYIADKLGFEFNGTLLFSTDDPSIYCLRRNTPLEPGSDVTDHFMDMMEDIEDAIRSGGLYERLGGIHNAVMQMELDRRAASAGN